jgi:extradiol dioxygenase family protein
MTDSQFHLAFPVRDLDEARAFYAGILGCRLGRSTSNHIDLDMFGHHVVAHLVRGGPTEAASSEFDGHAVPIPHFGLNLPADTWRALAERLMASTARFREYPHVRLVGQVGEHHTLFVYDPSGNALEFKAFRDPAHVFTVDPADASHTAPPSCEVIRPRVEAAIHRVCGRVDEQLEATGLLDSLRAMELVATLQQELGVVLREVTLADLRTVTRIVHVVDRAMQPPGAP